MKTRMTVLVLVLLAGAWFARPAISGGRAGAQYRFVEPPAFETPEEAAKWLNSQSHNGYVLKNDVILHKDVMWHLVPVARAGKSTGSMRLLFQAGRN